MTPDSVSDRRDRHVHTTILKEVLLIRPLNRLIIEVDSGNPKYERDRQGSGTDSYRVPSSRSGKDGL